MKLPSGGFAMRLRLAKRRAHHRRGVTDVTGIFPPNQCAHSAETRFTVTSLVRPHRNGSPRSWRGRRRSRIVWERSLGLSLLPHHSGYDRKEERDHQQPQEVTDDHPPRRENPKILGQSSYPHDAPPRKVVPCSNDPRGTSFPTKIMERRDQQPETLFDPLIALLTSDLWRGFSRLPRSQFD
jgi:hypothetical protein